MERQPVPERIEEGDGSTASPTTPSTSKTTRAPFLTRVYTDGRRLGTAFQLVRRGGRGSLHCSGTGVGSDTMGKSTDHQIRMCGPSQIAG